MNKIQTIYGILLYAALLIGACKNNNENAENKDSISTKTIVDNTGNETDTIAMLEFPYKYDKVLTMQENLLKTFSWPPNHELDLNDDGIDEEFQAIEGYSRGMGYALFCKEKESWKLISGQEAIASGHLGIDKLEKMNNGWHDFVAFQPSGRDGTIESYYTWTGLTYELKEQKEVEN